MTDIAQKPEARPKGFFRAIDFADAVLHEYQHGIEPGTELSWENLRPLYRIKRGQWTVITGIPSHGKSTFLDNILVDLSRNHGWKHLICSPENQPIQRHIEGLAEIYTGKRFEDPTRARHPDTAMTPAEMAGAVRWIDEHFSFINPVYTEFNIDYIVQLAEEIHNEWRYDGFVIDPYNELEHHRSSAMSETEYISSVISKFRSYVRLVGCHGWFVAHPTKLKEIVPPKGEEDPVKGKIYAMPSLYDVAGSAHWYNKCDNGIVVYRDFVTDSTTINVAKVRFRECGQKGMASMLYDKLSGRFFDATAVLLPMEGGAL